MMAITCQPDQHSIDRFVIEAAVAQFQWFLRLKPILCVVRERMGFQRGESLKLFCGIGLGCFKRSAVADYVAISEAGARAIESSALVSKY